MRINMETEKKAYIITLIFNNWEKQTWFEGDDTSQYEDQFNEAIKGLNKIGDECKETEEFFKKAINHIKKYGFKVIKK